MDVFVTGGSGFLGRHLLTMLTDRGHSVRALARTSTAAETVTRHGATAVLGDLDEHAALVDAMAGCDVVVHAAALTSAWGPADRFESVNVDGTRHVLDAARAAGVPRLVHVSSEAVLADGRPLVSVDENHPRPARPVGEYARTKGLAEDLVLAANGPDLTTVAVRPRLIWGPGDATVLPQIVAAARAGRYVWIDGGHYLTSTCHVTNACSGILLAAERGRGGQAYFLTDGPPVELRQFLTRLAATAGVELPDRTLPRWLVASAAVTTETLWRVLRLRSEPPLTRSVVALSGQEMTVVDAKARDELGYVPEVSREDGLVHLVRK